MDVFKYLVQFFFGTSPTSGTKIFLAFIIIIIVLIIDSRLGFVEHYYESRKIERISNIQKLVSDNSFTKEQHETLLKLQDDTIESTRGVTDSEHSKRFYNFWYVLSFSGLLFLIIIGLYLNKSNLKGTKKENLTNTGSAIFVVLSCLVVCSVFGWLFAYIKYSVIAFILNITMQLIFIWAIWYAVAKGLAARIVPETPKKSTV